MGLALLGLLSCGNDEPGSSADLEFTEVWTRQPVAGQSSAAVYATIANRAGGEVRILGVSTDVTSRAELHEVVVDDGLMTMRERSAGFVVPAEGTFSFEPGGAHVMLFDIDPDTYPSDAVDVTFTFDSGDPAFVTAEVRSVESDTMSDMDMDMDAAG